MANAPFTDAQDYLLQLAEKSPKRVIDLYTGQDTGLQLLILEAKEKGILKKTNGWFMYGETNLGANDEAVLVFLKTPLNKPVLDALKAHVYPEFATQYQQQTEYVPPQTTVEAPPVNPPKTTKKSSK